MGGGDAVQNALGVGDDGLALLQVFLLTGLQCGGIDGVDFSGQCFDLALLVGLAGIEGVQLALDGDQLAVAAVILCKQITVLGILVQQTQVQGRDSSGFGCRAGRGWTAALRKYPARRRR